MMHHQPLAPLRAVTLWVCCMALVLVGCGNDNSNDTLPADAQTFVTAVPSPIPTIPPTFVAQNNPALSNRYARLDGAVTVRFPDGWQVDSIGSAEAGTLRMGTSRAAQTGRIETTGDLGLSMAWAPVTQFGLAEITDDIDVVAVLMQVLAENDITADSAAIRTDSSTETLMIASYVPTGALTGDIQRYYALLNLGGGVAGYVEAAYIGDFSRIIPEILQSIRYDGPTYVIGGADRPLAPLYLLPHTEFRRISGVQLLDNDQQLLTWSGDGSVRLFDLATGAQVLQLDHAARIDHVQLAADASQLMVLAESDPIRLYSLPDGDIISSFIAPIGRIQRFSWSPDGAYVAGIVISNQNTSVAVWNVASGEILDTYRLTVGSRIEGIVWNNASTRLLLYGTDAQARVFGLESGERELIAQHQGEILGGLWRSDDARLVTFARDQRAILWDDATGDATLILQHENSPPRGGMFNSTFTRLLTWQTNPVAVVWDTRSGERIFSFETYPALGGAAYVLGDSAILAWSNPAAARSSLNLVDAQTGAVLLRINQATTVGPAALSADGTRLAAFGPDTGELYDVASGVRLQYAEHPDINGVALSRDGTLMVTYGEVGMVQVFDVAGSSE